MKYTRKCICHKVATKRIGKLDLCDDCAKRIHRNKCKHVWTDVHVFTFPSPDEGLSPPKLKVCGDILINVY
jgi:hypothetical protein